MPRYVDVRTQEELDAALKEGGVIPRTMGAGWFEARGSSHVEARESSHVVAWESSHVVAWESSHVVAWGSSHVEAWGSSHVVARESSHVEAWGSSHVVAWGSSHVVARGSSHVEARGSSHVVAWESSHVVAWGSSHVVAWGSSHVEAWGSSHVVAWGSSHVVAAGAVQIQAHDKCQIDAKTPLVVTSVHDEEMVNVTGGIIVAIPPPTTAEEWCAWHGLPVIDGVTLLFKAVRNDYRSSHGVLYAPGSLPEAPDWDGGKAECGGGLHFVPHPAMGLEFDAEATRFLACPVALVDIRPPKKGDTYPNKTKARRVHGPIVEVDRYGRPLTEVAKAS